MSTFIHSEQEICSDLWKVFRAHYNDSLQSEADKALSDFKAICAKYDTDFCRAMAVTLNDQLNLRWRETHLKEAMTHDAA